MRVRVLFFASCREVVGQREREVEAPDGATVSDLVGLICTAHPRLRGLERSLMLSVNQEYTEHDRVLRDGDEVAFIPPVSGG